MAVITKSETKIEAVVLEDVIAALRFVNDATGDYEVFGRVAEIILRTAPFTPDDYQGGIRLVLQLQREGALEFQVTK